MSKNTLKTIIIIFFIATWVFAIGFYFYNEHQKKVAIKDALVELANDLNAEADKLDKELAQEQQAQAAKVQSVQPTQSVQPVQSVEEEQPPHRFTATKPATCQIELAKKMLYNGSCDFENTGGGSFSITGFDINASLIGHVQEINVELDESKNGRVFGSNNQGALHEWGEAKRTQGCWIGSNFKVCAYANQKSKESSVTQATGSQSESMQSRVTLKKEPVKQITKEEELEHVRKVLEEGDAPPEVQIIVYCTRKAEIYYKARDEQAIAMRNCMNALNPNY